MRIYIATAFSLGPAQLLFPLAVPILGIYALVLKVENYILKKNILTLHSMRETPCFDSEEMMKHGAYRYSDLCEHMRKDLSEKYLRFTCELIKTYLLLMVPFGGGYLALRHIKTLTLPHLGSTH